MGGGGERKLVVKVGDWGEENWTATDGGEEEWTEVADVSATATARGEEDEVAFDNEKRKN